MRRLALSALLLAACAHGPDLAELQRRIDALEAKADADAPDFGDRGIYLASLRRPNVQKSLLGGLPSNNCSGPSAACSASSFTTTGKFTASDGTAGAPSYTFTSDTTSGLSIAAGTLQFNGSSSIVFYRAGSAKWNISGGNGDFSPSNNITSSIGSSGARVLTVFGAAIDLSAINGANLISLTDSSNTKTGKIRDNNDQFEFYNNANTILLQATGSSGTVTAPNGPMISAAGGGGIVNIGSTLIGQFTVDQTTHNSGADTTEDTLWTYSLPASSLNANGRTVRITAFGDGVSTADVTTVRCYFGATAVLTKVLTASQANTWHAVFEVTRTGATTQNASGVLYNGGTATSFVQTNTTPAETLSGAVTLKCTGQRATSSVANSVRQLYALGEFIN